MKSEASLPHPRLFSPTWVLLAAFGWAFAVGAASGAAYEAAKVSPPAPSREFRGVWVASVGNIDWPSRKGMTSAEQQTELLTILDRAQRLKLNAVVLQVRPSCDALYVSRLEPWSEFLSGNMGQAPEPFYDPLLFAVTEAHKRGLELHAWFNPYRARVISDRPASATHISKTHPELVRAYGKYLWLDPGEKAVQDYSFNVVMDVVKRYDIDGIHFDDYFYPYREKNAAGVEMSFPDDASWKRYGVRTKMSRDDWRRDNVNKFVERVYRGIKAEKPWVKFGISPFGIWRPTVPKGIAGLDTYAELYADTRKWLVNGWVDYFAPQIYWAISSKEQSFPLLLNWWAGQNPKRRQVFVGMDATKVRPGSTANDPKRWPPQEIVNQIRLARNEQGIEGHILWNMKSLARNEQFEQTLARDVYQQPALIPPAPWLSRSRPAKPSASAETSSGGVKVTWSPTGRDTVAHWVVQARTSSGWSVEILPASATSHLLKGSPPQAIAVTAVDRNGNASDPAGLAIVR